MLLSDIKLSRQLLNLHRAMTLQEFWEGLRKTLALVLPSHSISLYLNYLHTGSHFQVLHYQTIPGSLRPWAERRKISPTPEFLRSHIGTKIFSIHELIPGLQQLKRSEYFRKVMSAEGWHRHVCLAYWQESDPVAMVAVRKAPEHGEFSSQELELLDSLYDHFETALERIRRMQNEQVIRDCLAQRLPFYPLGLLILSDDGRLIFKNQEALNACMEWHQSPSRYHPSKAFEIPEILLDYCRALARKSKGTEPAESPVPLQHPEGNKWRVSIELIRPQSCCLAKPYFLVQFAKRDSSRAAIPEVSTEAMLRLQRLTPREREVALTVADGLSNREIAIKLGKTEFTVKAQILSIFGKLDVQRRSQLVSLLR
jgi:DNA-binding CsgD family transcriptional regulator